MTLKEKAKKLKTDIPAVFLALKDNETPIFAKILAGITTLTIATSVMICSFVSCDENDPSENTHVSSGLLIEEQEANGISLCATPIGVEDYEKYQDENGNYDLSIIGVDSRFFEKLETEVKNGSYDYEKSIGSRR